MALRVDLPDKGKEKELQDSDYRIGRTLRKTSNSDIKLALCRSTNTSVVLKLLHTNYPKQAELAVNELRVLHLLGVGHCNVVRLLDERMTAHYHWIVLEYATRGDVFELVKKFGSLPKKMALHYFKELASGLEYIHSHGIAHFDLSLENLLIDNDDKLKICDFGISRGATPDACLLLGPTHSKSGKFGYMAPEVFINSMPEDIRMCDIFSMGVCLLMMMIGIPPWKYPSYDDTRFRLVMNGKLDMLLKHWKRDHMVPAAALDLLNNMLCPVDKRYTIEQVLAHPWLAAIYV